MINKIIIIFIADTLIVNNAAIQTSTTKHPRLQSTTMKSSTIKITSLNNSEEPTVKSTESTHHSTTLRIVTHAKPEHEAVIGNLKSPKLNMLILGISISAGITALVICILIVLMILKKRRYVSPSSSQHFIYLSILIIFYNIHKYS